MDGLGVCPHQITSLELCKWTNFRRLKQDFQILRDKIETIRYSDYGNTLCTRRDLFKLLNIRRVQTLSEAEVIEIRLRRHTKILELSLKDGNLLWNSNFWLEVLEIMDQVLGINDTFCHVGDEPDSRWFFKNRIMKILHYNALILGKIKKAQLYREHSFRPFMILKNYGCQVDEQDSQKIIKDMIHPILNFQLDWNYERNGCDGCFMSSDRCNFCQCNFCFDFRCTYAGIIQSLCDRHESMLDWLFKFAMEQLRRENNVRVQETMSLLSFLLMFAGKRSQWELVNTIIAQLLRDPRREIRSKANYIFAFVAYLKNANLTMLSSNLDIIKNMPDHHLETREYYRDFNQWLWIGTIRKFGLKGHEVISTFIDYADRRLDRMLSNVASLSSKPYHERRKLIINQLEILLRLIMPPGEFCDRDPYSFSDELVDSLKLLAGKKTMKPIAIFWNALEGVFSDFELEVNKFNFVRHRTAWLLIQSMSSQDLNSIPNVEWLFRVDFMQGGKRPEYLRLLLDIHRHLAQLRPGELYQRFIPYLASLIHLELKRNQEERNRLVESLIIRYQEQRLRLNKGSRTLLKTISTIAIRERYWSESRRISKRGFCERFSAWPTLVSKKYQEEDRLLDILKKDPYLKESIESKRIFGIQSRRMQVVSLCKLLIINSKPVPHLLIEKAIITLEELQLAYELRQKQEYQVSQFHLLPTCLELAFPTPFDDPESLYYICEFAYFRDTLDYAKRKNHSEFRRMFFGLADKIKGRLRYYKKGYENFEVCCSKAKLGPEELEFSCSGHGLDLGEDKEDYCPLLERNAMTKNWKLI